jgi:hypothetical protein
MMFERTLSVLSNIIDRSGLLAVKVDLTQEGRFKVEALAKLVKSVNQLTS